MLAVHVIKRLAFDSVLLFSINIFFHRAHLVVLECVSFVSFNRSYSSCRNINLDQNCRMLLDNTYFCSHKKAFLQQRKFDIV